MLHAVHSISGKTRMSWSYDASMFHMSVPLGTGVVPQPRPEALQVMDFSVDAEDFFDLLANDIEIQASQHFNDGLRCRRFLKDGRCSRPHRC